MKRINIFVALLLSAVLITIYKSWLTGGEIIGGDWPYFYKEMLSDFSVAIPLWRAQGGVGLGGIDPNFAFLSYQHVIVGTFVNTIGLPWYIVYKVFWFGLFIVLSIISVTSLLRTLFININLWQINFGNFIFLANTYILMIVGGGQMGVALAYSIAPLVLARFIKLVDFFHNVILRERERPKNLSKTSEILRFAQDDNVRKAAVAGLVLAIQLMFDIRIAYITLVVVGLYILFHYVFIQRFSLKLFTFSFSLLAFVVLGLHAYWIVPFFVFNLLSVPEGLTSIRGFEFFSFAAFSQTLSLLHPNWPENIFGKTYFLQPEFLLLPMLAYSSLLFLKISNLKSQNSKLELKSQNFSNNLTIEQFSNRTILFFALLGIFGAFLAKGANEPFGFINTFLFENIPGMSVFRDPTKFYLLVALSYSILIPFSVYSIYNWLKSKVNPRSSRGQKSKVQFKIQNYLPNLLLLLVVSYLLFLIRPTIFGQLGGTFRSQSVPREYVDLKNFIVSQPEFFRTLWIPTQSRFRIQTENHPLINGDWFFKASSTSGILKALSEPGTRERLAHLSVKYIIIPYDSTAEIFLEDRRYDRSKRVKLEREIDKISWLKKVRSGNITVYETPTHKDHFYLEGQGLVSYQKLGGSKYAVKISDNDSRLIFSEKFHPFWRAQVDDIKINPKKTKDGTMLFELPSSENFSVYFEPETFMKYSYLFSFVFLLSILIFVTKIRGKESND